MVATGETSRLVFHVSPLSAKGLLSQQTRDALKAILKANNGAPVVHIRAFVAGSGDLRRVPQIVSEVFGEKKMQLPSVSVVQAGGLPLENAQVVIEAVSVGKKEVNPDGLMFVEAQPAASLEQALDKLASRLTGKPLRVSCFVSAIGAAGAIASRFPSAAVDLVQTQREPARPGASCEAIARGGDIKAMKLAFTGTRVLSGWTKRPRRSHFRGSITTSAMRVLNPRELSRRISIRFRCGSANSLESSLNRRYDDRHPFRGHRVGGGEFRCRRGGSFEINLAIVFRRDDRDATANTVAVQWASPS